MPHIHDQPGQHDHTASAYILRLDEDEPRLLLHLHKKLGVYLQFGGHVELDESPWQAVAHEIKEESGYELGQLQILQPKSRLKSISTATLHPQPVCHNTHDFDGRGWHYHTDLGYGFVTNEQPKHALQDGESSKMRAVTRKELIAMPNDEIYEGVREIALFIFDECLPNWERVDTAGFA